MPAGNLRILSGHARTAAPEFVVPLAVTQEATPADAGATTAVLAGECLNGTREENVDVAQRYLDVWNSKDLSLFDDLAHPDVVHHWGQGEDTTDTDALKASTEAFFTAFLDMVMTFDQVIAEDDLVVIRWTLNGTQTGPFFELELELELELEPSGNEATWSGINIYRVSCGKVVESWSEVGLREQLAAPEDQATPVS